MPLSGVVNHHVLNSQDWDKYNNGFIIGPSIFLRASYICTVVSLCLQVVCKLFAKNIDSRGTKKRHGIFGFELLKDWVVFSCLYSELLGNLYLFVSTIVMSALCFMILLLRCLPTPPPPILAADKHSCTFHLSNRERVAPLQLNIIACFAWNQSLSNIFQFNNIPNCMNDGLTTL